MSSKSTSTDVYTWALVALERTMCSAVRRRMFENGTISSPRAASGARSGPAAGDTIVGDGAAGTGGGAGTLGGGGEGGAGVARTGWGRATASGAGAAAGAGAGAAPASSPMTASTVPTAAVSPSGTRISVRKPPLAAGTSESTLSVDTSKSGSSASTPAPTPFSHPVLVASGDRSPSFALAVSTTLPPSAV